MKVSILTFIFFSFLFEGFGQIGPDKLDNYIRNRFIDNQGREVVEVVVPGHPPTGYRAPVVTPPKSAVTLTNVPAFTWCFGCSATSAAMEAGYYDNQDYPNMYTGPTNGGVIPMNNSIWGTVVISGETRAQCPLSATRMGLDERTTYGHVDDYWIQYGNEDPDPYITNGWTEHEHEGCTGDFMGTNQSYYGNSDGSTTFYYYSNGNPMNNYTGGEPEIRDGCHGMRLFYESRGYTVTQNYTQLIFGYNGNTLGFTLDQFKNEIDNGRPVLIQVVGHTMLGYGYEDASSTIYIHDTWDYSDHSMTWGGSYSGMEQWGVTVVQLAPAANAPIADFTGSPTTLVSGGIVTYTDISTGNPTSWLWTFEGGTPSTSTLQNPIVTYSETGSYSVTLVATNSYGSDTEIKTNYITAYPSSYAEDEIGHTIFDLQSNAASPSGRLTMFIDGTFAAVYTRAVSPTSYSDRGTGYNYFDGTSWGSVDPPRIESLKTGWPSHAQLGTNGEVVVSHQGSGGLVLNIRNPKGTGTWAQSIVAQPSGAYGFLWPRMATGGTNKGTIHIIALTTPVANGGTVYNGQDGALVYLRSQDGGTTWDKEEVLPGLGSEYSVGFVGDGYSFAEPRNNIIAFAVTDDNNDLIVMKSINNGESWQKIVVWQRPNVDSLGVSSLWSPDNCGHLAIDASGKVHLVFGVYKFNPSDGSWFPYSGGIAYWNEDMPTWTGGDDEYQINCLNPDSLNASGNLIATAFDINGNGSWDVLGSCGLYYCADVSMPQIAIDDNNEMIVVYSAITENLNNGIQDYRHLWCNTSNNQGATWSAPVDLTGSDIHMFDECVFPSICPESDDEYFYLIYQLDVEPGLSVRGDLDDYTDNYIYFLKIPKNDSTPQTAPVTTAGIIGAAYNASVQVPITVTGFDSITACSLRLEYDPAVLTYTGYSNVNSQLSGMLVNDIAVSASLHKVIIVWSDIDPKTLPSNSKLLDLDFTYLSGTTSLAWNNSANGGADCEYADAIGDPLPDVPTYQFYIDGEVHWQPGYQVSGVMAYNNGANTPLDQVEVDLMQNEIPVTSAISNTSGYYEFSVIPDGSYKAQFLCTKPWTGVNATDALKVQRHAAGLEPLTEPVRLLAADVNNSGSINATDALKIKRRVVGLDTTFARGDWTFTKPTIGGDSIIINGANVTQNFYGLCVGDVNGSNIPATGDKSSLSYQFEYDGDISIISGTVVELPIRVRDAAEISAITLNLQLSPGLFQIQDVKIAHGEALFNQEGDAFRIIWSEIQGLSLQAGDTIIRLEMLVNNSLPGSVYPLWLNEGCELADLGGNPINDLTLIIPKIYNGILVEENPVSDIRIYPNPTSGRITVGFRVRNISSVECLITDIAGRELIELFNKKIDACLFEETFEMTELQPGIYIVNIRVCGNSQIKQMAFLRLIVI